MIFSKRTYKKNLKKLFKGSSKDPFFYLGACSVVLFGIIIFTSYFFLSNSANSVVIKGGSGDFYSSISGALIDQDDQLIFLSQNESRLESPDLYLVQGTALRSISPPITLSSTVLGIVVGSDESSEGPQGQVVEYIVAAGDSLSGIAQEFEISLNTLLWANDLTKSSTIRPGQKLIILPVSGVIYHVQKGDTIGQIAKIYKGDADEIVNYNGLTGEAKIFIGDILIIPEGQMPPKTRYAPSLVPVASSYFICPISAPCRATQGLHWYNAIDFGHGKCSEPIFSAAGGTVQKTGYSLDSGNYVRILHPNGVVTAYGHLQNISVKIGQKVSQGEIIGLMGHTGYTIPSGTGGCHLHFAVHGARNPFVK